MSQENVRWCGPWSGFNAADRNDLGEWVDQFFDPEIEWHDVPSLPGGGVHFGRDAYLHHVSGYREAGTRWILPSRRFSPLTSEWSPGFVMAGSEVEAVPTLLVR